MRNLPMLLATSILVSGCSLISGPGTQIGWRDAIPPVTDGVGRIVKGDELSQLAFVVTPDMVEELDTYKAVSTEQNSQYKAAFEAVFEQAAGKAGLEFVSGKKLKSDKWKITQLKNFDTAITDTEFAYRCLTASNYSFTVSRKTAAGVGVDATKLAETIGASSAKVEVGFNPAEPDKAEITVDNPRVCLSFVSAYFKRDRPWWSRYEGSRPFKVGAETTFTLKGKAGAIASAVPDFGERAIQSKPHYKLYAVEKNGLSVLQIKVFDPALGKEGVVIAVPEITPGEWDQPLDLPRFKVGKDVYGFMRLEIKATRNSDNEILVSRAALFSPEYKLIEN